MSRETVGSTWYTDVSALHGDLFLLLCVGVELDFKLANVLTGLVNGKKQTKNRRQLLKIFYIFQILASYNIKIGIKIQ